MALCAVTKLTFSHLVGRRNSENTQVFVEDVASRLRTRVQISTDGLSWYLGAEEKAFGWNGADYAQLVKTYGVAHEGVSAARRYSPMECTGAIRRP